MAIQIPEKFEFVIVKMNEFLLYCRDIIFAKEFCAQKKKKHDALTRGKWDTVSEI